MKTQPTTQLFLDEIDAIQEETRFALDLAHEKSPFNTDTHIHLGEGGATSAHFQDGKLVGVTSRMRDENNSTILVCIDLR